MNRHNTRIEGSQLRVQRNHDMVGVHDFMAVNPDICYVGTQPGSPGGQPGGFVPTYVPPQQQQQQQYMQQLPPNTVVQPPPPAVPAFDPAAAQREAAANVALGEERARRQHLEQEAATRQAQDRHQQLQTLQPAERAAAIIGDGQAQITQAVQQAQQAVAQARAAQQRAELDRYIMKRVTQLQRDGVQFLEDLVGGNSVAEVDISIQVAQAEYIRLEKVMETRFRQKWNIAENGVQGLPTVGQQNQQWNVPANPAYTPAGQPGQMPTAANPQTVAENGNPTTAVFEGGVENAVRSGAWGQLREQFVGPLKGTMGGGPPLGSGPRQNMQYTQQPYGVQQPQGYQTGPAQSPHYAMQPQYQQPPPQPYYPPQQYQQTYAQPMPYQQPYQAPPRYAPPPMPPQYQPPQQMVPVWNGQGYEQRPAGPPPYGYGGQQGGPPQNFSGPQPYYQGPAPMGWGNVEQLQSASVAGPVKGPASAIDLTEAASAVARTYNGQNPFVGQIPGAQAVLTKARQLAANRSAEGETYSPQDVYRSRFVNTPPLVAA